MQKLNLIVLTLALIITSYLFYTITDTITVIDYESECTEYYKTDNDYLFAKRVYEIEGENVVIHPHVPVLYPTETMVNDENGTHIGGHYYSEEEYEFFKENDILTNDTDNIYIYLNNDLYEVSNEAYKTNISVCKEELNV